MACRGAGASVRFPPNSGGILLRIVLSSFALALLAGTAHAGDQPLYKPAPDWVQPAPAIDIKAVTADDPMVLRIDQH